MKVFVVTGTPGTGKTRFARRLARKGHMMYVDVARLIREKGLYMRYDRRLRSYVADVSRVVRHLQRFIAVQKKSLVIDSHLSHYLPPRLVTRCYVTVCNLKTLRRRLQRRKYPQAKIRENLDAEILQICLLEAIQRRHHVFVVNTSHKRPKVMRRD